MEGHVTHLHQQIHQKYNASTCWIILNEYLLNTDRRAHEIKIVVKTITWPCWTKGEGKKGIKTVLVPLGESYERGKFLSAYELNPLHCLGDQLGKKGNFRGSKESAASGLQQQNRKRLAHSVLATFLHSAWDTCLLVCMGVECWNIDFSEENQREDCGWLHRDKLKGLECSLSCNWGYTWDRV